MSIYMLDKNIFKCDVLGGPSQVPPKQIKCPHCRSFGTFITAGGTNGFSYQKKGQSERGLGSFQFVAAVRICPNPLCLGLVFTTDGPEGASAVLPPLLLDIDLRGVPQRCAATLMEAVACHGSSAFRASAMMIRRLLEEICDENGCQGKNLHDRLEKLKSKITIPMELFDAMFELKVLGNDAAHVQARDYDNIGPQESELAIELAKEIVKALYQLDNLVQRLKAMKNP